MTYDDLSGYPLPTSLPFTFATACDAGMPKSTLARLLVERRVRRVLKGVYVDSGAPDSQLLRAQAMRLVVPQGYVVTDESAGWLAGAAMILRPGSHLQVPPLSAFATAPGCRLRNGLTDSGERGLLPRDVTEVHGVLATTPLRTFLDLARLRHPDRAIGALDQLLRLRRFDLSDAYGELWRFRGMRGVVQARWLLPFADPRPESPPESTLWLRMRRLEMPEVVPQAEIHSDDGRFLGRGDLPIPSLKLLVEYDGEEFHTERDRPHDEARRSAFAAAGWIVLVLRRQHVYGHRRDDEDRLWAAVQEARRTAGRRTGRVIAG